MAYITFKNMEEYEMKVSKLAKKSKGLCKVAVYDGAGFMADAIKKAVEGLPIEESKNGMPPYAKPGTKLKGVSEKQKRDLIDSLGIAKWTKQSDTFKQKSAGTDMEASKQKNGQKAFQMCY